MKRNNIVIPRHKSLDKEEVLNPFVHELKLSFLDKLQVAIMSITVAPIRLLLLIFFLLAAWPLAAIAVSFRSDEDKKKPMAGWRLRIGRPMIAFGRGMFRLAGIRLKSLQGTMAERAVAPVLVAAHHTSMFDTLLFFLEPEMPSAVSRAENARIPIIGTLIEFSQPVLVNRKDPDSRANTIREIQNRGQSGAQWPQIIIFPEGTCSNRSCLISFKQGAFCPGVPVQPVCIKYPNKLDTVTWTWKGPGAFTQLWLTLCQFYTNIEIEFLPVYYPNEDEKKDAKLYANNVREVMARALNCRVTEHTYDDVRLMSFAQAMELPATTGLVEFERLHSKLGLTFDQMQKLLVQFRDIKSIEKSKKKSDQITYENFAAYLRLPATDALRRVFDMYDRNASGTIDFREYVIGLSFMVSPLNRDSAIQVAFELFDSDNKGHITMEGLQQILSSAFNITNDNAEKIFSELDIAGDGKITLDKFKSYAEKKPEYARVFVTYQQLKQEGATNGHTNSYDLDDCDVKVEGDKS